MNDKMKEKTIISKFEFFLITCFLLLIPIYQILDMLNSRNVLWRAANEGTDRLSVYLMLAAMIGCSGLFYLSSRVKVHQYGIIKWFWILLIWSTLCDIIRYTNYWLLAIHVGLALLWIFIFTIGVAIGCLSNHFLSRKIFSFFLIYWGIVVYSFLLSRETRIATIGDGGVFNLAYSVIVFVPFFLLNIEKKLSKLCLLISILLILLSLKRGAIIILPLMLWCYHIIKNSQIGKSMKNILMLPVIVIVLLIGYLVVDNMSNGMLSHRFSTEELSDGSGRASQFRACFQLLSNSSALEFLWGLGAENCQRQLGIAVHNEILAWLSYYGVVGLICFFSFLGACVWQGYKLLRDRSPYAASYFSILIYFFVTSLISGFYFMHMTMILFLTLGLICGKEELRLKQELLALEAV